MKKPSFIASADARLITHVFEKIVIGGIVSFKDISDAVSRPVEEIRGAIATALRTVRRDHQMVFKSVRSVGYQRATDSEIIKAADQNIGSIRRKARNSLVEITLLNDYGALTPADQLSHTLKASVLSAVAEVTHGKSMKKLEKIVGGRAGELPIKETLLAFSK